MEQVVTTKSYKMYIFKAKSDSEKTIFYATLWDLDPEIYERFNEDILNIVPKYFGETTNNIIAINAKKIPIKKSTITWTAANPTTKLISKLPNFEQIFMLIETGMPALFGAILAEQIASGKNRVFTNFDTFKKNLQKYNPYFEYAET